MFEILDWKDVVKVLMAVVICILIGWLGGWLHAHRTVATECRKLGSFYVGDTVFKCVAIEPRKD